MKIGPWGLLARKESLNVNVFCVESRDQPDSEGTGETKSVTRLSGSLAVGTFPVRPEWDRWRRGGAGGPQGPVESDCKHLNVWLDFLPEHGSHGGAWWGRWQPQFHPAQEHVFLFPPVCEGACGLSGWGEAGGFSQSVEKVLCGWLWQACLCPTLHLPLASLNCPHCFQPLDLCNPARTLLLSEELLLYEGRNKAIEVRLTYTCGFTSIRQAPAFSLPCGLRIVQSQGRKILKSSPSLPCHPPLYRLAIQLILVHFQ